MPHCTRMLWNGTPYALDRSPVSHRSVTVRGVATRACGRRTGQPRTCPSDQCRTPPLTVEFPSAPGALCSGECTTPPVLPMNEESSMKNTHSGVNRLSDNGVLMLLALSGAILHVVLSSPYGFHRDELDIIMNARQLDWGYVAYPPVTPFFARIGLLLFGNSLPGLRIFSAIGQGVVIVLVGLMAQDLGGKRPAQIMAGLAAFVAPVALFGGSVIQYMAFDYVWWVLLCFFTVRLLATENPRLWLGIGAAIGLGMMTKYTIAFYVLGMIAAVLVSPARRYMRSRWLWAGAALAFLIFPPQPHLAGSTPLHLAELPGLDS